MPELPEVQTTVDGLNARVAGLKVTDIWTDYNSSFHAGKNNIKNPKYFAQFKKEVIGAKITHASREGKNVLIHLSNKKTILVHMKMTGHFLYGAYKLKDGKWLPVEKDGPLHDPFNRHVHLVFSLSDKKQLAFSDLRKFGKVFLFETESSEQIEDLMHLGPDPLKKDFTYAMMKERLALKPNGKMKQVLMDQTIIAGIGNIYSDEMLWSAGIHPLSKPGKVPEPELKKLYKAMQNVLRNGIDFGGDSDSDYRNIDGEPGKYQNKHNAYRRTGQPCPKKDGGIIERIIVASRSGHFCPVHQKLFL
jgi:formamidopyrimidine-DNA glycosylase